MTRRTRKTRTAQQALAENYAAAIADLERIKKALEERANTSEKVNWGHVGDMHGAAEDLRNVADMLCGTGEYAE